MNEEREGLVVQGADVREAASEPVYRTQREIDAAMGRRLRQERERWGRRHRSGLWLEAFFGEGKADEAAARVIAEDVGLPAEDVLATLENGGGREEIEELARERRAEREIAEMRGENPAFDAEEALSNPPVRALVHSGEPLRRAMEYARMEAALEEAREEGRMEVIRSIRERQVRPGALRGYAQGSVAADFSNMPEAALRMIDERLKRGERVRV